MKKIAVLTSGGDAPGMNAAVRAIALKANSLQVEPVAVQYGFRGLVEKNFYPLMNYELSHMIHTGGTVLYTARFEEFLEERYQRMAIDNLWKEGIEGLVVIGGDGSYKGAEALSKLGFPTVALPGTIDNDIGGTDYTIGFDTALTTAVDAVDKIRDTATSHERIFIVEVMGRCAGDIAYWTGVSTGADMAIIPEQDFSLDALLEDIQETRAQGKKRYLIVLSEGAMKANQLGDLLKEEGGHEVRTSQLGHIQRGGNPTAKDRVLASRLGSSAVHALVEGQTDICVGIRNNQIKETKIDVALKEDTNFMNYIESHEFDFLFSK